MTNSISKKTDHKKYPLKLLSVMLVVLMMLTLFVACSDDLDNNGSDDDVTNNTGNTNDSNNDANNDSNNGVNSGDLSQNTATTTYSLKEASPFSDGVAYVTLVETSVIDGNTTTEEYQALIDTTGKVLHKFSDSDKLSYVYSGLPFFNGVSYDYRNYVIYDRQFQTIASPETKGYDSIVNSMSGVGYENDEQYLHKCGYFLVCKTEESFNGDKFYLGVIDSKGEYTIPLSDAHPIAALMAKNGYTFDMNQLDNRLEIVYIGNGYYGLHPGGSYNAAIGYYNVITNKITVSYPHYEHNAPSYGDFSFVDENGIYKTLPSGEYTQITDNIFLHNLDGKYKLMDCGTNTILIDFGEYELYSGITLPSYLNGYFLTTVKNAQGAIYCCLFNEGGEPIFEPIRLEDNSSDKHYELTDEGFIIKKDDGVNTVLYFCDYKGNLTNLYSIPKDYIHGMTLEGFQGGLALIKTTENWDSEYKFVSIKGESLY